MYRYQISINQLIDGRVEFPNIRGDLSLPYPLAWVAMLAQGVIITSFSSV